LLRDFPFVSDADRAGAIAALLEPFARELISGPLPAHVVESPGPGSGKGLLADMIVLPALGGHVGMITEAREDDEWRKRITSELLAGQAAIRIDNVRRQLSSGALAAALTTGVWGDRKLGRNEAVRVAVRCSWLITGNNVAVSTEIARRC